jgi:hypothetical protein
MFACAILFYLPSCSGGDGAPEPADGGVKPVRPVCNVPQADLRRPISETNPMFIYNVYGEAGVIKNLDGVLPADVKPYFALQIIPPEPYTDSPSLRKWIEDRLDAAQGKGLPVFIQTEHCNTRNTVPQSYWAELFDRYSILIGLSFAELSCSGLQQTALDDDYMERMKATIDTVSAKKGFFLWQDMGYDRDMSPWKETPQVFVKAGSNESLFSKIRGSAANVIIQDKHNGSGKRFTGPAAVMGLWTSCSIGNWGVNSEDWLWWEAGYGHLFEPWSGQTEFVKQPWKALFTFPEAMYGIDWLAAMAGGATVFALECPYHGLTSVEGDLATPSFEHVLLPLIRTTIKQKLIPARGQVREKMQAAYHPVIAAPPEFNGDQLFAGLYGPEVSSLCEWLPSTGRYYYLPIIPQLSGQEIKKLFPTVVESSTYKNTLATAEQKRAFFDPIYPEKGKGDSWFVNLEDNWFIMNPNENKDVTTTFEFSLNKHPGATMGGSLTPHTFVIVVEQPDRLIIHLSNYRTDSEAGVWDNQALADGDPGSYVRNVYIPSPADDKLRRTSIAVGGVFSSEPAVSFTGDNGAKYTRSLDAQSQTLRLEIDHNGYVDMEIPVK